MINKNSNRIIAIDAIRSYAILAMVFGHTIGLVLDDSLRSSEFFLYAFHRHFSGITAPVFFFSSGLIFTYLLFNAQENFNKHRLIKGIKRSLYLVIVGFLIQISFRTFLNNPLGFLSYSHVIQCIGLCIFFICILYFITFSNWKLFLIMSLFLSNLVFLSFPFINDFLNTTDYNVFSIFFSKEFSVFPFIPWVGSYLIGAFFGALVTRYYLFEKKILLVVLIIAGVLLTKFSWSLLWMLYSPFIQNPTELISTTIFTYFRLGETVAIIALIAIITNYFKLPDWFLTNGKETLSIYVFHNIVIYGAFFGFGYKSVFKHSLSFLESTILVIFTLALMIVFANILYKLRPNYPWLKWFR